MKNISIIQQKDKCCGCGICSGICPKGVIRIQISEKGFYRPVIDEKKCVKCGICLNKCPIYDEKHEIEVKSVDNLFGDVMGIYSGWAKDNDIRYNSASGGIATALSLEYLKKGYVICGTGYDENNELRTKTGMALKSEDVLNFISSKYMPSEYSKVAEFINKNRNEKIIIIGLPCQIAGIRKIIEYEYSNIILIDIFCGKIMSYKLLDKYTKEKNLNHIEKINFRDKNTTWYDYSISIKYNGKFYSEEFRDSLFGRFLNNKIFTQNACYDCNYGSAGTADITLGDFWDKEKFENEINGVSIIVVRTELGKNVIETSNNIIFKVQDKVSLLKTQPHFWNFKNDKKRKKIYKKNKKLYKDLNKYSLVKLDKKYNNVGIIYKIKSRLKKLTGR